MKKYPAAVIFILSTLVASSQAKRIVVDKDGSGNYKTVQEALHAVPLRNAKNIIIYIKNGIYKEKLHLDSLQNNVTLTGEDKFNTILTYNDHTGKVSPGGDTINTRTSATFVVKANDFVAENITFQNDAGFTAGQAVGLEMDADRAVIKNCRIVGNQDILFTNSDKSRQYYRHCYIEGTTDFIFGSSTVWFEQCHIHSKKASHITAASTPKEHAYGYIFNDCILTGDSAISGASLGRPWRPDANVIYLHCYIDKHIRPEGWSAWNNTDSYKHARYAEYESYGPGGSKAGRISWSRQLTETEAGNITMNKVFGDWKPE